MNKKAKGSMALVILLIILLLLIVLFMIIFLMRPTTTGNSVSANDNSGVENNGIICGSPYINVGGVCCLDSNNNMVCDKDETTVTNTNNIPETIQNQEDNAPQRMMNKESRIISSQIDFPFRLSSMHIYRDEFNFILKNSAGYSVVINKISVDDCDDQEPIFIINSLGERKFVLNCDFNYGSVDNNIDITYTKICFNPILNMSIPDCTNETQTASGDFRGFIERNLS